MVWLIPALALLKACCEQWMVCEIGFPIFLRKSEKNSSSMEEQNKRMNEHVGILQKKLCIFTKVYFSNTLYLTSKIVYTMPEMNQIIV